MDPFIAGPCGTNLEAATIFQVIIIPCGPAKVVATSVIWPRNAEGQHGLPSFHNVKSGSPEIFKRVTG